MLSGDNGVLQKATDAKQTSERAEAKELAKIDIMAWITDKTANHQDASLDDEKVKEILSDNKSYVKEAKETSFITSKGEYEIPYSELYTTSGKTPSNPALSAINYGNKTAQTVGEGDTISIEEEQFMVLTNDGSKIMAIPYYNITQSTTDPVQSSDISETGTIAFCPSPKFWTEAGVNTEPMSSSNIQQYISAYSAKLYNITNGKVTAEVGRYYGVHSLSSFDGRSNSEGKMLLNPGFCGDYWLGSNQGLNALYFVFPNRDNLKSSMEPI